MPARALISGFALLAIASIARADAIEGAVPLIDPRPSSPLRLAFRPASPPDGSYSREHLERVLCGDGTTAIDLRGTPGFSNGKPGEAALPPGNRIALLFSSPLLRIAARYPGLCSCGPVDVERVCACALPPRPLR
jgi:hypothetical protein